MTNFGKFSKIENQLYEIEDDIHYHTEELDKKLNSMKEQLQKITILIEKDNKENNDLIEQSNLEMKECEEKFNKLFLQEKQVGLFIIYYLTLI